MHIGLRHIRQIIVDHAGQLVDIDASGRYIRRDQYPQLFILKIVQRPLPGALGFVSVDRLGDHIALRQLPDHPVCPVLRARKYQRRVGIFCLQNMKQQILFIPLVHKIQILLDGLHRGGRRGDLDFLRVFQDFRRQLGDVRGHRGREKQRLLLLRRPGDNFLDVVDKSHIQHAVRLVQHQNPDLLDIHNLLVHQIQKPSRRRHQDIHAPL